MLGWLVGEDRGHANRPSPPCGTTTVDRLQARRLRAAELFAAGVRQAKVARQLEVSAQAVSVWHRRWKAGGPQALRSMGPSGPVPRLSDEQLAAVERALLERATANGFVGELWTLDRIALVIERLTGVHHHPDPGRVRSPDWAASPPNGPPSTETTRPLRVGMQALFAGP